MTRELVTSVAIVGGGLMGASTALFLRQRGVSVALLERGLIGQQASGVNYGNVRRQGRAMRQLPLAHRSREIWGRLAQLTGSDVEFLPLGHLRVVYTKTQFDVIEAYAHEAKHHGLDLELFDRAALLRRYPFFGPEVVGGSLAPQDGHANPRLAAPAIGRAARKLGAQVFENCEVIDIAKDTTDFRISTRSGPDVRAPVVLVCAGAWAAPMAAKFGEPVPLTPLGPTMGVTEPVPYALEPSIGVSSPIPHEGVYYRQVKRGNIVFGGGLRNPAYLDERRSRVDPRFTLAQLRELRRVMPAFTRLNVIRTWTGVEGYLPDEDPVMGESSKASGLYYAFGFSGQGFQLGPGVGDVMAELIATGCTSTPIDAFNIRRFANGQPAATAVPAAVTD